MGALERTSKPPVPATDRPVDRLTAALAAAGPSRPDIWAGRLALAFDATSSMHPWWKDTMAHMRGIVERLAAAGGRFEMAILAYRDHCDGPGLLEDSGWLGDRAGLERFLAGVHCHGGGDDPEAVDVALKAVLARYQGPVILVGDAPPHTDQNCEAEARALGAAGRPVYAVHVGAGAAKPEDEDFIFTGYYDKYVRETEVAFRRIADLSGGKYLRLGSGAEGSLSDVVGVIIAHAIGGPVWTRYLEQNPRVRGLLPAPAGPVAKEAIKL